MPGKQLPLELWLDILGYVAGPAPNFAYNQPRGFAKDNTYRWAPYASVNSKWQEFFERRSFASIALSSDAGDVEAFSAAITRCPKRLAYIGRLQLIIDLPKYDRKALRQVERAAIMDCHDKLLTRNLWQVMNALSHYKEPEVSGPGDNKVWRRTDEMFRVGTFNSAVGIQLELGVQCASDAELFGHSLPSRFRSKDGVALIRLIRNTSPIDMSSYVMNYIVDSLMLAKRPEACQRVMGRRLLVLGNDRDARRLRKHRGSVPVAPVVSKLVISRRFQRGIHPDSLTRLLNESLPCVHTAHLEPWRPVTEGNLDIFMRGYGSFLDELPASIDNLNIFVESDCIVHYCETEPVAKTPKKKGRSRDGSPPTSQPALDLGLQVALASRRLATVNIAFLVEAQDVFAAIARMPASTKWPRLRKLILTSTKLANGSSAADVQQLLCAGAASAARMPQLREFEVWHAHGEHRTRFTVTCRNMLSSITFDSSWLTQEDVVNEDVLSVWQAVVADWTTYRLEPEDNDSSAGKSNKMFIDDGRSFILCNESLACEAMLAQSRQEMMMERLLGTYTGY